MKRLYFDNNATSPVHPAVAAAMTGALESAWGNPSSVHEEGRSARRYLEEARDRVASLIGSSSRELVFTSGGSESNNMALVGVALQLGQRCHIVTTAIEHPSALRSVEWLRAQGHDVTFVGCRPNGAVDPAEIEAALRDHTKLVAIMLANNETGVIQPVAAVSSICRERGIHVHCDAVQAVGRIPVNVGSLGVDTLSIAAHKMHGPKGVGALWLRTGVVLEPLVKGGAQERRRRAGTESVALAVGFAAAADIATDDADRWTEIAVWRDQLESQLVASFEGAIVNGAGADRLPNTTNICFRGHDAEGIVIGLDLEGVAVSTGSACSSGRVEPSDVLIRMGLSEDDARSSVRISLGRTNEADDMARALGLFRAVVPRNRRDPRGDGGSERSVMPGVSSTTR